MAVSVLAKKVKVSKNRKPYWRKLVNLKDVEEFLEEERQNERFGGAAADKPDDQLFVVENRKTAPSSTFASGRPPVLRCFQNLQPDSAVVPPIKPHQLQGTRGKAKVQPSWVKDKRPKIRTRVDSLRKKGPAHKTAYDLWSTKQEDSDEVRAAAAAAESGVDVGYLPDVVTRRTVKVPEYRYQKPSLLAAVETPHPGASYNPTYEDHQELLMSAHQVEAKRQKEEDYLTRNLTSKFPKRLPTQKEWLEEMSAGLFDAEKDREEGQQEEEEQPGPPQPRAWGQPVSFHNKKTKAEKNQEKALKNEKRKVLLEKVKKRRLNDLNSVKALKKQIVKAEKISEERMTKRQRLSAEAMYQPRRIGPCKYVAPELEIQLQEDLPENLRTLKMEGHLLEDRFKSLQRRNLIEPRRRQKAPKKKVKVLLRRTHRD